MALFGNKKDTKKDEAAAKPVAEKAEAKQASKPSVSAAPRSNAHVLIRPRITEKAANMTAANVYAFDIAKAATKRDVIAAVKALYKVTPAKVNVVNVRGKRVAMRKRRGFGMSTASKKAYVFLKKGDTINLS